MARCQTIPLRAAHLETKSVQVLGSISELREALKSCADGDLISHPNSLEDPYRNARVHQIGGDYAAARRSYLEYFKHNLPLLDPHLRFIAFLKVQEGTAGARETYNEIVDRNPGMTTNYACLLLLDREQRIAGLETFQAENSDFAPAAYLLRDCSISPARAFAGQFLAKIQLARLVINTRRVTP